MLLSATAAASIAATTQSIRCKREHVFVRERRQAYDWDEIRSFYELGHTPGECQTRFGISNGAWYGAVQRGTIVLRDTRKRPRSSTRNAVAKLLADGCSQAIARRVAELMSRMTLDQEDVLVEGHGGAGRSRRSPRIRS